MHHHWTLEQWKRVLWSNKSRFSVWQSDGVGLSLADDKRTLPAIPRHFGQCYVSNFVGTVWERSFSIPAELCPNGASSKVHNGWISLVHKNWSTQIRDPIQHLCDELEQRFRARTFRSTSGSDLTNALLDEWAKTPTETLQNLLESLPRRVEAVVAVKVGPTPLKCEFI